MATSMATHDPETLRTIFAERRRPAKAGLALGDERENRAAIGACIDRARKALDWNLDELADRTKKDRAQLSRWIAGTERPQFDALMAAGDEFWCELVTRLARLSASMTVDTIIRRTA